MDEHLLESRLLAVEQRNARVEAEKAWEVSTFRRMLIAVVTYTIAAAFLVSINAEQPFLSAIIPTIGYVLSTLSLPAIKRWWISHYKT
jgi:hypothetical protein